MLDRKKNGHVAFEDLDSQTAGLTSIERRLIDLYRRLTHVEQQQVRRLAEIMAINPKEPLGG